MIKEDKRIINLKLQKNNRSLVFDKNRIGMEILPSSPLKESCANNLSPTRDKSVCLSAAYTPNTPEIKLEYKNVCDNLEIELDPSDEV